MHCVTFLFHGYGGDPDEFAAQVAPALEPDGSVQSLSSGHRAQLVRRGYQWYAITSDDAANRARASECAAELERKIRETIGDGTADLVGFSQGAMVALALALRGRVKIGRVACLSGAFGIAPSEPIFADRVGIAIADDDPFCTRHLPEKNELIQNDGRVVRFRLQQAGHQIGATALAWLKTELRFKIVKGKDTLTHVNG